MAGWPSIAGVDDRQLAETLHAAGADAVEQIFDTYGVRLYDYCHILLRDQDDAAGALHDAFIVAVQDIAKLREPDRFRSWLYAIVRNECLRRRDAPNRPAERHEAPEADADASLDDEDLAHREETRQVVFSAMAVLDGLQREAVDLVVRHELDLQELASVLGISAQRATELVGEAGGDLDDALAAAIIAGTGQEDCPSVAALVDGWPLSAEACERLIRHINACPVCGEARDNRVSTRRMLQALPIAQLPAELLSRILTTATAPECADRRMALAQRAEPLDAVGFPVPLEQMQPPQRTKDDPPRLWLAIAAAACGVIVIGAIIAFMPGSGEEASNNDPIAAGDSSSPASSTPPWPTGQPSPTPTPTSTPSTMSPTPSPTHSTHKEKHKKTHKPGTGIDPNPPSTHHEPRPHRGTLSVSGCHIEHRGGSCSITVTAQNGPVDWSVTATNDDLSASPSSGHLAAGESAHVTATQQGSCWWGDHNGSVSFSPGGTASVSWTC